MSRMNFVLSRVFSSIQRSEASPAKVSSAKKSPKKIAGSPLAVSSDNRKAKLATPLRKVLYSMSKALNLNNWYCHVV